MAGILVPVKFPSYAALYPHLAAVFPGHQHFDSMQMAKSAALPDAQATAKPFRQSTIKRTITKQAALCCLKAEFACMTLYSRPPVTVYARMHLPAACTRPHELAMTFGLLDLQPE